MKPSARRNNQRGTRRFAGPRCPSNSRRIPDVGTQPIAVAHYIDPKYRPKSYQVLEGRCTFAIAQMCHVRAYFTQVWEMRNLAGKLMGNGFTTLDPSLDKKKLQIAEPARTPLSLKPTRSWLEGTCSLARTNQDSSCGCGRHADQVIPLSNVQ